MGKFLHRLLDFFRRAPRNLDELWVVTTDPEELPPPLVLESGATVAVTKIETHPNRPPRILIVAANQYGGSGHYARYALYMERKYQYTRELLKRLMNQMPHSMCADADLWGEAEEAVEERIQADDETS